MAATITPTVLRVRSIGDVKEVTYNVAISGTYTDNGDALTFATLGLTHCEEAEPFIAVDSPVTSGVPGIYDITNQKVVLFCSNGASPAFLNEVPAGTTIGTRTFRLKVHGKGPVVGPGM